MTIKLSKVVTENEELPLIRLPYPSITWFCEVTRRIKNFISLDQWPKTWRGGYSQ